MTAIPNDTLPLEAQLVDAMRDGLAIFDPEGNLLRWNSSARAITGWTPGEAGQRGLAALPPGVIQIREGKWADARHLKIDEAPPSYSRTSPRRSLSGTRTNSSTTSYSPKP